MGLFFFVFLMLTAEPHIYSITISLFPKSPHPMINLSIVNRFDSPDSPCNSHSPCGCMCRRRPECASACRARPPRRIHLCSSPSSYPPCNSRRCNTSSGHSDPGNPHRCRRIRVRWCTWNPRHIPPGTEDARRSPI